MLEITTREYESYLVMALGAWATFATAVLGQTDDDIQTVVKRVWHSHRRNDPIKKGIHDAKPEQYPAIEGKLLAVLAPPEATFEKRVLSRSAALPPGVCALGGRTEAPRG